MHAAVATSTRDNSTRLFPVGVTSQNYQRRSSNNRPGVNSSGRRRHLAAPHDFSISPAFNAGWPAFNAGWTEWGFP